MWFRKPKKQVFKEGKLPCEFVSMSFSFTKERALNKETDFQLTVASAPREDLPAFQNLAHRVVGLLGTDF